MNIVPLIMAGGAGVRLWPLSRDGLPKQFHNLSGRGTLMEETIKRLLPLKMKRAVVVTALSLEERSRDEIQKAGIQGTVLSEPRPRNTAAAVLYGALYLDRLYDDSIMIVLPADHHIGNEKEFLRVLGIGVEQARKNGLVTIGIRPDYPETGYGYIKSSEKDGDVRPVERFVEKPDHASAEEYLRSGDYFWNSGIFLWKTSVIIDAFREFLPDHIKVFDRLARMDAADIALSSGPVWEEKVRIFDSIESVSIDKGIMEKARGRVVIPGSFGWADLGSWKSIDDILPPDENSNRSPERDRAVFVDSSGCSVFSEAMRVSVLGLSNVVVVEAGGEVLVLDKDASQDVKKVVDIIKKNS